nr:hypothetical protein [Micromonospora sp. DSM 115978]
MLSAETVDVAPAGRAAVPPASGRLRRRRRADSGRRLAARAFVVGLAVALVGVGLTVTADEPARAAPGSFVSDEFGGTSLDTGLWTELDPVGDSAVGVSDGELTIAVPGGSPHDMWSAGLSAPQVVQE